jgi:hypothetical protein
MVELLEGEPAPRLLHRVRGEREHLNHHLGAADSGTERLGPLDVPHHQPGVESIDLGP